jgi:hypothetical protein
MTTSQSPLWQLKKQADAIARSLKDAESGDIGVNDPAGKIAAARKTGSIRVGVIMDDKTLKIDISWDAVRKSSEAELSAWILGCMQDNRSKVQ